MATDPKFTPIFTNVGLTKIANAMANGTKIVLDKFAIGDANATDYTPSASQFALVHELTRINLRTVWYADFSDGSRTLLEVSALIKSGTVNGTIREIGIYDASGDLVIIARTPDRQTITVDNLSININYTTQVSIANNERVFAVTQAPSGDFVTLFEYNGHINDSSNPHNVSKAQILLGNVDNTADNEKNVLSATKITTARNINGISFNGTADINLEDRIGANIASAATTVVGTVGIGDYIKITGVTNIASLGTAGRAGIKRTLIFDNALSLIHGANLICPGGANISTIAGSIIEVVAETTTIWRVISMSHASVSMAKLGYLANATSDIQTQINDKAPLASPSLTGTPTAPTATAGVSTTQLANTAFVTNALLSKANTNQTMYIGTTSVPINRGSGAISLTGTNIDGNAGTATKLQTARTINGVNFDGSAPININTVNSEVIKFDSGINEGTDLYTFNGSSTKTIDIKAGANVTLTKSAGVITISANDTSISLAEITGLGANVNTFLASPTSDNLKNAVVNNTGSGALVFANTPTLISPNLGNARASSVVLTNQVLHSSLVNIGLGDNAPLITSEINIGAGTGYIPLSHQRVLTSAGYRNNTSFGAFRFSQDWSNSGAYVAIGGSDNNPTEAFHFRSGGKIESTLGNITMTGHITGNSATATTLQNARTINGVSFNGSANIIVADNTKLPLSGGTLTGLLGIAVVGAQSANMSISADANYWKYLRLKTTGEVIKWDIATKEDDLAGALQFRAGGAGTASLSTGGVFTASSFVGSLSGNASTATVLQNARTIGANGDATGVAQSFNGSANITIPLTLSNSGVTAGTYSKVIVDAKGRVTAGLTPTMEDIPDATFKRSARVATTASITLSGLQTIDGITLVAGDRVLVKNQSSSAANGIYVVSPTAWTRSLDANTSSKIASAIVAVDSGAVNGGKLFDNDFKTTDTLNTTGMIWNMNLDDASLLTSGTASIGMIRYNGNVPLAGQFHGGAGSPNPIDPGSAYSLKYTGYFYPSYINLSGSADTSTASTHVFVETEADGFVRPKPLSIFKSEIFSSPTLVTPNIGVATGTSFNSITGLSSTNPIMNGSASVGTSTTVARADHVHASDTAKANVGQTMYIGTTSVPINRGSGAIVLTGTGIDGNAGSATVLSGDETNWAGLRSRTVANMLSWKNYGNGHIIFDASASTAPNGAAVNNADAANTWSPSYPTLMGWNGAHTYGVRVDSARVADRAYPVRVDGGHLNFNWSGQSGQPPWLWGGNDGANMYVYNPSNFTVAAANSLTANATGGNLALSGRLTGGLGADQTTSGATADWNHSANCISGSGPYLLLSDSANGPYTAGAPSAYYHVMCFEYASKTGGGNITQIAIPYADTKYSGLYIRGRYSGTWTSWRAIGGDTNCMGSISFNSSNGTVYTQKGICNGVTIHGTGHFSVNFSRGISGYTATVMHSGPGGQAGEVYIHQKENTRMQMTAYYGGDNTVGAFNPGIVDVHIFY